MAAGAEQVTVLTVAAFLGLATACQSAADPNLLLKIATVESHLEAFAIHDNSGNQAFYPATKPEAYRLALALIAAGHTSLDIGLDGINTANFAWLGLTMATALDPCTNIAAEATVLTSVSRYNTGSPTRGISNGYVGKVLSVHVDDSDKLPPEPDPAPQSEPSFRDALSDSGGLIDLLAHQQKASPEEKDRQ